MDHRLLNSAPKQDDMWPHYEECDRHQHRRGRRILRSLQDYRKRSDMGRLIQQFACRFHVCFESGPETGRPTGEGRVEVDRTPVIQAATLAASNHAQ
jgi:hypothetical protein